MPSRVKALFLQALELEPERRAAFLDERCAGDAELRAAVEELLRCDAKAQSTPDFLHSPAAEARAILAPAEWDTAPLKTRYQARREAEALRPEAERLVEQLWRQKKNPDDVAASTRSDPSLSEPQRHAAFRALLQRPAQRSE